MDPIRAAGGVLWKPSAGGPLYCVVHRSRYDDWSLPKGKLDKGEHPLAAAVREVREETGVRGRPELRLPQVTYDLPDGVPKTVEFWLMRAADAPTAPLDPAAPHGDEVDERAWLPMRDAVARVDYPEDVRLLNHVAALPEVTDVLPLVRHAHAGKRDAFPGDDAARPLDDRGRAEAAALAPLLALFDPQRLVSATPLRCVQTLAPLAELVGLPVVVDPRFDEPVPGEELSDRVAQAVAAIAGLRGGLRTVICSQGKVIPPLLATLDADRLLGDADDLRAYRTPKGTGWVLSFAGDRLIGLERLVVG
jgi:8-oxo-dGTP pyrophosphatase MutT (NUDIX family)